MTIPVNMLFPVETINRELDFRVMLAERMAQRGHRVYIGKHAACMRVAEHSRGGVFFGKGVIEPYQTRKLDQLRFLQTRDYRFVHLDTEGAVYPGDEDQWRRILDTRIDPTVLGAEDYICTWGDFQRDHYREQGGPCRDNIRTTGHPRFDLYKPAFRAYYAPQAQAIRARYGDFVLLNTNLARANNKCGMRHVFSPNAGYMKDDPIARGAAVDTWAYKTQVFAHFVRLVHQMAAEFRDLAIVVRPHPSEESESYQLAFAGLDNVFVSQEGPVSGWLLAARAMIHDGCTTGIEARLADCPIINFRPVEFDGQELLLPNAFGRRCHDTAEVFDALEHITGAGAPEDTPPNFALNLLENLRSDAFERVDAVLEEVADSIARSEAPAYPTLRAVEIAHDGIERCKQLVRPLSPRRMKYWLHSRQKFAGFDPKDLASRFTRAACVLGAHVRHTLLGNELILVERD